MQSAVELLYTMKGLKMARKSKAVKAQIVSAIYNISTKSKAELRAESEAALKKFLRAGGEIQTGRKSRNRKSKMACKSSKGFQGGSSGFANGFPRGVSAFK